MGAFSFLQCTEHALLTAELRPCSAASTPCGANTICQHRSPGSFKCACKSGYRFKTGSVTDCDGQDTLHPLFFLLLSLPAAHVHACASYRQTWTCLFLEIDACAERKCSAHSKCIKTGAGQRRCECEAHYEKTAEDTCEGTRRTVVRVRPEEKRNRNREKSRGEEEEEAED